MSGAILDGAYATSADLRGSLLREAKLRKVSLNSATLIDVDFTGADLRDADLGGADLRGNNLTKKQLDNCRSFEGATMPNGQKYEDWIKSNARREDGEDRSSS